MRGSGRAMFVAILLLIAGTLNVIYGIAAVSNANFFDNTQFVFAHLHTWGWITIVVGAIQFTAGLSLLGGGAFGWVIGLFAASVGALESLLSVGGTHPWWPCATVSSARSGSTARRSSAPDHGCDRPYRRVPGECGGAQRCESPGECGVPSGRE